MDQQINRSNYDLSRVMTYEPDPALIIIGRKWHPPDPVLSQCYAIYCGTPIVHPHQDQQPSEEKNEFR